MMRSLSPTPEEIASSGEVVARLDPHSRADRSWAVAAYSHLKTTAGKFEAARRGKKCPYNATLDARTCNRCESQEHTHRAQSEYSTVQRALGKFEDFFRAVRQNA